VSPDMDDAEQFRLMAQLVLPSRLLLINRPRINT
jgi:hypothetical protein